MSEGKQKTPTVKEWHFTKDELAVLDPLDSKRRELQKQINQLVSTEVIPRIFPEGLESNKRYNINFDIQRNSIRIKDMETRQDLTKENWQEVLGYGEKEPGR